MAVTSIMTSETEIDAKAGADAPAAFTEAMKDAAVLQGESLVNDVSQFNFSDKITSGMNVDVKGLFSDFVSSFVAIQWISYDMNAYSGGLIQAEDMLEILRDGMLRAFSMIRNQNIVTFVKKA